jgi:hypothetical protein
MFDPPAAAPKIEPTSNDPPVAPPPAWQAEVDTQQAHTGMGIDFGLRKKKKQRMQRVGFVKQQTCKINKRENLQVALTNMRNGLVWSPNPEALNNSGSELCSGHHARWAGSTAVKPIAKAVVQQIQGNALLAWT